MAKDPAFLFYHQDFFTGVSDMTNEEVGAYIRCLCVQASKGGISEKHMKIICNSYDVHNSIKNKFTFDPVDNLYKNERLSSEIKKRKDYSISRANNRKSKKNKDEHMNNISKSYVKHMENENENENEIKIEKEKGGLGEKEKTNLPARMNTEMIIQMSVTENTSSHELIDMQNKLPKGSAKKMSEIFLQMLQSTGELQKHNPDDLGRYFYNWANYHAKRMRSLFQNEENRAEIVSDYFTRSDEKQNPDEMLKSLHAYLK
jgi:hypothetical protein